MAASSPQGLAMGHTGLEKTIAKLRLTLPPGTNNDSYHLTVNKVPEQSVGPPPVRINKKKDFGDNRQTWLAWFPSGV